MARKIWKNHSGQEIKPVYVPKIDKVREKIVDKYITEAVKLSKRLAALKEDVYTECDAFIEKMYADMKVKYEGKGNFTLTSYDKTIKIEISVNERIEFDDSINLAHDLIKQFFADLTKDSNIEIIQIINSAFQTSRGKLDVKKILGLFEIKIEHPTWLKAMELIKQSISRNNSRRYVRFWKKNEVGDYKVIDLNFSSL